MSEIEKHHTLTLEEIKEKHEKFKSEFKYNKSKNLDIFHWVEARSHVEFLLKHVEEQRLEISSKTNLAATFESALLKQNDLLIEKSTEIKRLEKIEKAAKDAQYYQGTEGSADRLEAALREE